MAKQAVLNRRRFLRTGASVAAAAPLLMRSHAYGAGPNDRIVMGCIGMGGQGRGDMGGFLGFDDVQVVAVCDVVGEHRQLAKDMVDRRYGNKDCQTYSDFREITRRPDIDAVLIGTPDHWHAVDFDRRDEERQGRLLREARDA